MQAELTPQQSKALDYKHSIALRANAGSGKTFVLARRYLQIALEGKIPLQKIAAITFTDKAAGELYKRIAEEVENLLIKSDVKSTKQALEKIRRQLVSANISTIHSFCINILREFPVEAELDANFTPVDQNTASELLELSIEDSLKASLDNSSQSEIRFLIRLFGSKSNLVKQLRTLTQHRKILLVLKETLYKKDVNKIADYFHESFDEYFKLVYMPLVSELIHDLAIINNLVLKHNPQNKLAVSISELIISLQKPQSPHKIVNVIELIAGTICTQNKKIKKRDYLPGSVSDGFEKEVLNAEKIINEFSKIQINEYSRKIELQLALTGKYLINLFNDVLLLYDRKKKELGYLDYEDILLKTRKLLTSNDVIKYLSDKFSYLMVDEYQDTNEIQYEIFMPILEYLKKGNLFIVGDEKQSIYRFRDAELEIFERTSADIEKRQGNDFLITLPDSFRMEPVICLFANVLFRNLFKFPNQLYNEVGHSDIICAKSESKSGGVEILVADEESGLNEAELLSKRIIDFLSKKDSELDWKDLAILVRRRSSFRELEKEFTRFDIPYRIIGGRGFFQRQSMYDIHNYFSFLLDTENDAALAGILRSPFFSFSDAEIFKISLNYGKSFWLKMLNSISRNGKILKAVQRLKENIELASGWDISALLWNIFDNTEFVAVLAARPDGDQELANIEKLKRMTNNFNSQGFRTLYDYVNYLKEAISKLEDEAQAGLATQANAVNILTLHQSKGLEFPVVFLYKCNESLTDSSVKSKSVAVDKNCGLLTKVPIERNYFEDYLSAPIITVRNHIEHRKNLAESKRLFYVGVTRAKTYLFITATKKGNNAFDPESFIGMLFDALSINQNAEDIVIGNDLTFLFRDNGKYKYVTKHQSTIIHIIKKIELPDIPQSKTSPEILSPKYLLNRIQDISKGEIISATKVSTYSQCPFKYCLIYKYGYSELFSEFSSFNRFSYNDYSYLNTKEKLLDEGEAETYVPGSLTNIKGQIIHKALQREIVSENLNTFVKKEINSSYLKLFDDEESKEKFTDKLIALLEKFYNSAQCRELVKFEKYTNESEIYLNEKQYFLFGIIDKLIVNWRNIIIVDYKTDDIALKSLNARAEYYLTQLNFYVYIISNLYKEFDEIEIRIIFLKYPDNPYIITYNKEAIREIGGQITNIIEKILSGDFSKNPAHCSECNFAFNNKCLV